ncbi:hypothetical protein [Azotobacter armeniacus]
MGLLTKMTWPKTTLLDLLNDAESREGETFNLAQLELRAGRDYMVAVISGEKAGEAYSHLAELKQ